MWLMEGRTLTGAYIGRGEVHRRGEGRNHAVGGGENPSRGLYRGDHRRGGGGNHVVGGGEKLLKDEI